MENGGNSGEYRRKISVNDSEWHSAALIKCNAVPEKSPDLVSDLRNQTHFVPLLGFGKTVALFR
ncbi:hypothetical protein D3C76_1292470 [compost metagenome]